MTVKSFWMDAQVRTATVDYNLFIGDRPVGRIGIREAARMLKDPEVPQGWRVERRVRQFYVPACPWCGARPLEFEMDCDGPASTGTCGSPQCNQLRRCEGCGTDGTSAIGSFRGHLCRPCDDRARREGLVAASDRYELVKDF